MVTMKQHHKMMDFMKITMPHDPNADHVISLTIIDKKQDRLVTDARVLFHLTPPNGKKTRRPGMIMRGKGMYHYAGDFKKEGPGGYVVETRIQRGSRVLRERLTFPLK